FLTRESQQAASGIVDLGKPPAEIGHEYSVRCELDELAIADLGAFQGFVRAVEPLGCNEEKRKDYGNSQKGGTRAHECRIFLPHNFDEHRGAKAERQSDQYDGRYEAPKHHTAWGRCVSDLHDSGGRLFEE